MWVQQYSLVPCLKKMRLERSRSEKEILVCSNIQIVNLLEPLECDILQDRIKDFMLNLLLDYISSFTFKGKDFPQISYEKSDIN